VPKYTESIAIETKDKHPVRNFVCRLVAACILYTFHAGLDNPQKNYNRLYIILQCAEQIRVTHINITIFKHLINKNLSKWWSQLEYHDHLKCTNQSQVDIILLVLAIRKPMKTKATRIKQFIQHAPRDWNMTRLTARYLTGRLQ